LASPSFEFLRLAGAVLAVKKNQVEVHGINRKGLHISQPCPPVWLAS
jgi:hypothetical protein